MANKLRKLLAIVGSNAFSSSNPSLALPDGGKGGGWGGGREGGMEGGKLGGTKRRGTREINKYIAR